MPRDTTTYRYFLPTGEEYGGADLDTIFALHPDAMVTAEVTWDVSGNGATRTFSPPLTLAGYTAQAADLAATIEADLGDGYIVTGVDDDNIYVDEVEDDRESVADGDADEAGAWGDV